MAEDDSSKTNLLYVDFLFSGLHAITPILAGIANQNITLDALRESAESILLPGGQGGSELKVPAHYLFLQWYHGKFIEQVQRQASLSLKNEDKTANFVNLPTDEIAIPVGHFVWRCSGMPENLYTTLEGVVEFAARNRSIESVKVERYVVFRQGSHFIRIPFVNYREHKEERLGYDVLQGMLFRGWPVDSNEVENLPGVPFLRVPFLREPFLRSNVAREEIKASVTPSNDPDHQRTPRAFWDEKNQSMFLYLDRAMTSKIGITMKGTWARDLVCRYTFLDGPLDKLKDLLRIHTLVYDKRRIQYCVTMNSAFVGSQIASLHLKRLLISLAEHSYETARLRMERGDFEANPILYSRMACTTDMKTLVDKSNYIQWLLRFPEMGMLLLSSKDAHMVIDAEEHEPQLSEDENKLFPALETFEKLIAGYNGSGHTGEISKVPAICCYKVVFSNDRQKMNIVKRDTRQKNFLVKTFLDASRYAACLLSV